MGNLFGIIAFQIGDIAQKQIVCELNTYKNILDINAIGSARSDNYIFPSTVVYNQIAQSVFQVNNTAVQSGLDVHIESTTESTSSSSGALTVAGGAGVDGSLL